MIAWQWYVLILQKIKLPATNELCNGNVTMAVDTLVRAGSIVEVVSVDVKFFCFNIQNLIFNDELA
jgi:hypothetical protein